LEGGQRGGLKSVEVGMIEIYFLLISRQLWTPFPLRILLLGVLESM
jgi:hypothetical protein